MVDSLGDVVMESLMLALVGRVVGGVGVAAVSRLAGSVLFGVAPQDPLTLGTTAADVRRESIRVSAMRV